MYDKEMLQNLLIKGEFKSVDDEGNVLLPSNDVYQRISKGMLANGVRITSKHVYTIVKGNRSGLYDIVLRAFGIIKNEAIDDENSLNNSCTDPSVCASGVEQRKEFRLVISADKWSEIKPETKIYGDRKYITLKGGVWTHVVAEKIWDQTGILCALSFKYAKVYKSTDAKCYVRIKAKCKECSAKLFGFLYEKPKKGRDAIFECELIGSRDDIMHKKKRQLKGRLREKIASNMLDGHKEANVWRVEEANRLMKFADQIPPMLYDTTVLRKAKEQELNNRLQLLHQDPIHNLQAAKYIQWKNAIHGIGADPFYCMYWTSEQCAMHKAMIKDPQSYMTIDATGGLAKKIKLVNEEKSLSLFLYQCMTINSLGSIPTFQMLSAKQDAAIITYFLLEIIRSGAPVPRMTVTDFGRAILIAIARAFADCADLADYMQVCYDVVVLKSISSLPSCYIRLDVSHIISMVSRWHCLRGKTKKTRQYFIRCVSLAYQMTSIDVLQDFLYSVLVVALSEEIGEDESGELLHSEMRLRSTNEAIKGISINEDIAPEDSEEDVDFEEYQDTWSEWSRSLYIKAEASSKKLRPGNTANAFYNKDAAKKLMRLISSVPLWTGIMRPYFEYGSIIATSSSVEAHFADLKSRAFKGLVPMRADKFVLSHLEYTSGKLRLAAGEHMIAKKYEDGILSQKAKELNEFENWRGRGKQGSRGFWHDKEENVAEKHATDALKNQILENERTDQYIKIESDGEVTNEVEKNEFSDLKKDLQFAEVKSDSDDNFVKYTDENPNSVKETVVRELVSEPKIKKRKRNTYLDPCVDWDYAQTTKTVGMPVLRNGSFSGPVKLQGMTLVLQETCPFDSLLQVLCHAIGMFQGYRASAQTYDSPVLKLALSIMEQGKVTTKHYAERASILLAVNMLEIKTYTRRVQSLDANCNAPNLADCILLKNAWSFKSKKTCVMCEITTERSTISLSTNVDMILTKGLSFLQQARDYVVYTNERCRKCDKLCDVTIEYGSHVIFDTSIITDPNYKVMEEKSRIKHTLRSVAKSVELRNEKYYIAGVVSYRQGSKKNLRDGHYVAYVCTGLTWLEYDDTKTKRSMASVDEEVFPHALIYVKN